MKIVKRKSKPKKWETIFEKELERVAPYFKCRYTKIPDAIKTKDSLFKKKDGTYGMVESKRPCDGILSTPIANFLIECKFDDGRLKPHQVIFGTDISKMNNQFYVLRKRLNVHRKRMLKNAIYTIEVLVDNKPEVIFSTEKIEEIFLFFSDKDRWIKS